MVKSGYSGIAIGEIGDARYETGKGARATPTWLSPSSYSSSGSSVLQKNNTSVIRSTTKGCISSVVS